MPLSTGIDELDRRLDGGLIPGSVVAVTAPPETQFGPLLAAGLDLRPTTYFTTVRTPEAVRESVGRVTTNPDLRTVEHLDGASGAAQIVAELDDLSGDADIVVDVMDPIESATGQPEYVEFLNAVSTWATETDGLAVLHCLDTDTDPENRKFTLSVADAVFELSVVRHDREAALEYRLAVPKASGITLTEGERMLDIDLGRDVYVDVSRSI